PSVRDIRLACADVEALMAAYIIVRDVMAPLEPSMTPRLKNALDIGNAALAKLEGQAPSVQPTPPDERPAVDSVMYGVGSLAVLHRDNPDGTRTVIRRHDWGFSETRLKRDLETKQHVTLSHDEWRFDQVLSDKEP